MKKLKIFFAVICCALCLCLPLAACNNALKDYVSGSLNCNAIVNKQNFNLSGYFKVTTQKTGYYYVTFSLEIHTDKGKQEITSRTDFNVSSEGQTLIVFDITENKKQDFSEIKRVNITKVKVESIFSTGEDEKDKERDKIKFGYTLGFGIPSAVILCGLIVVFVLDKTGVFKKK